MFTLKARHYALFLPIMLSGISLILTDYAQNYAHKFNEIIIVV